jgi:hypothetical protein
LLEVVASGEQIRNATLLHDGAGYLAVYLDTVDETDQVMAVRIDCK